MELDHFAELLDHLSGVRRRGDQVSARCPAHDDTKASLSIGRGEHNRVLITCHAGCRWQDVLAAVGMEISDAFGEPHITHEYVYTDANGRPVFIVERWSPKTFRQRMANGERHSPADADKCIYNLPVITNLAAGKSLFYCEGEKDVDTLAALGYPATTTPGGAGKPWLPQYSEALAGKRVIVVADNDAPGRRWAHQVAEHLRPTSETRIIVPPKGVKDVTELIEGGYKITDMVPLPDTHGEISSVFDYPIKQVEWLWPTYIPAHTLTLLEGDPGTGKSTVIVELIGRLTSGRPLPGTTAHSAPLTVGMLSDEDSFPMVVAPRLQAAEADLTRVLHFRGIRADHGFLEPYSLLDLATLRHDVRMTHVDVLVIDPLMAYLGHAEAVDTYKDQNVRSVLGPLVQMAEEDHVTIIAIRHFTKAGGSGKPIYRGGGSIGFTGQARSILQTGEHPELPNHYVLASAKNNMAPPPPSLGYQITQHERLEVGHIVWNEQPVAITAAMLGHTDEDTYAAGREAIDWLRAYVDAEWTGEPFEWKTILTAAKDVGIARNTLERHRSKILMLRIDGPGGRRAARWIPITPPIRPSPVVQNFGEMGEWENEAARDLARRMDPSGFDNDDDSNTDDPPMTPKPQNFVRQGNGDSNGVMDTDLTRCSKCESTDVAVVSDGVAYCGRHNPMWSEEP